MTLPDMHPEDIKAEIRKRFRTVAAFERHFSLPAKSVNDLMRGNKSQRVAETIQSVIERPVSEFAKSEFSDDSDTHAPAHRLNDEAR